MTRRGAARPERSKPARIRQTILHYRSVEKLGAGPANSSRITGQPEVGCAWPLLSPITSVLPTIPQLSVGQEPDPGKQLPFGSV